MRAKMAVWLWRGKRENVVGESHGRCPSPQGRGAERSEAGATTGGKDFFVATEGL
jgi:hypothetical protein